VFGTGAGLGAVKRRKAVRVAVIPLRVFKLYGGIFCVRGRLVTGFVRSESCICADSFSLRTNAFFKSATKLPESKLHIRFSYITALNLQVFNSIQRSS
jgi:hypothetical protein